VIRAENRIIFLFSNLRQKYVPEMPYFLGRASPANR
jgi:hypothetical protein